MGHRSSTYDMVNPAIIVRPDKWTTPYGMLNPANPLFKKNNGHSGEDCCVQVNSINNEVRFVDDDVAFSPSMFVVVVIALLVGLILAALYSNAREKGS